MEGLLLIFAKEPKKGNVKTRLAKDIGKEPAKKIYEAFLKDIVKNVVFEGSYETKILCTPESSIEKLKSLLDHKNVSYQKGDGLTQRLCNAFEDSFNKGYKKVIAIGTDAPLVNNDTIRICIDKLDDYDCVIGPATDGGYYLIGLRKYDQNIFENISWSTEKVFLQTKERLKALGYSYFVMQKMADVDELKDLIEFKKMYDELPVAKKKLLSNLNQTLEEET